ncbi:hypothetical protein DFJ73DRAFT_823781 [Zopfochytrium polystomum]|nr:hypothetical protein DFJ73DRAFT_823781 [Zopfochytrium polystomum]
MAGAASPASTSTGPLRFIRNLADLPYRPTRPDRPFGSVDDLCNYITGNLRRGAAQTQQPPQRGRGRQLEHRQLRAAISAFDGYIRKELGPASNFSFIDDVLPHVWSSAQRGAGAPLNNAAPGSATSEPSLDSFESMTMEDLVLPAGTSAQRTFSARSLHSLLSNAFLLNLNDYGHWLETGDISLEHVYNTYDPVGYQRILCLLQYFYHTATHPDADRDLDTRRVVFERISYTAAEPTAVARGEDPATPIPAASVRVIADRMESPRAGAFVDFANKRLHIHTIIPSATQEEVLFSACPEAFASILLYETLKGTEVAVIRGVRRYAAYTGYLGTFQFAGAFPDAHAATAVETILAVDATESAHFALSVVRRDVDKAVQAFAAFLCAATAATDGGDASLARRSISTGHWGCGVFGGDKAHKFLQQVVAFARALALARAQGQSGDYPTADGPVLYYAAFGEGEWERRFKAWLATIEAKKMTVGQLEDILYAYRSRRQDGEFSDYLDAALIRESA